MINFKSGSIFTGIIMVTVFMAASFSTGSAGATNELVKRSDIADKYKWNLKDIYTDEALWEKDFKWIETNVDKYKSFEGKLGLSAKNLLECFTFDDEISNKFDRCYLYANLSKDLDVSDGKYQDMYERINNLGSRIAAVASFIRPEILSVPDNKIAGFMKQEKGLKLYGQRLNDLLRMKPHTLSKEEEQILAFSNPLSDVYMETYRMYTNADMKFPTIKDEKGQDIELSHARYYSTMMSLDRNFRERGYKAFFQPFINMANTITTLYNGSLKYKIYMSKSRKYSGAVESALNSNNIPVDVYKNLVSTVGDNLKPIHRFAALKKKLLGIDKLHPYDTYVTLFPAVKRKYTYDEAVDICLKALKPLGDEYIKDLKYAFDNRWVDVYETKNKRSGAYSSGTVKGVHPYVLLNWAGELNDVFTLAHEMGHTLHSYYTQKAQPYPYADYPIFLAEVASITNEILLMNYLIDNVKTKEEKLALLETYLNNIQGTFYRQTRFAEFEMKVQEMAESGKFMNPEDIANFFGELFQKYWGPEMITDKEEKYSWMRIHHFFYNFYVYQYATGMSAAEALAAEILAKGQPAVDKYLGFLKAGKSDYAINILKKAGVDMTKPGPVLAVVKRAGSILDQMEELLK